MPDGPDVRALAYLFSAASNGHRPMRCTGCPFADPVFVADGRVLCQMLGGLEPVNASYPRCTAEQWGDRARQGLTRLLSDNAMLTAVAHDAREESSMYARGLAEGKEAEREACCKAVCPDCAAGRAVRLEGGVWYHDVPNPQVRNWRCRAGAIRRRAGEDGR